MAWNAPLKKHSFRSAKAYSRPLSGSQRQPRMSKTNKAFTRHHDASDKHLTKRHFGTNRTRYSGSPAVVGWCTPCILWGCGDCYFWLWTLMHHHTQHSACQRKAKRKKKTGRICQHQKTGLCWTYSGWKTSTSTISFGQHGPNAHVASTAPFTIHITVCTAHNNQKQRANKHSLKYRITGQSLDSQV